MASAAASAARAPDVPRSASAASISARRRLNARSTARGTPSISAMPLRTGVHSTPSVARQLAAQHRLVDELAAPRVRVEPPAVERRPAPVGAAPEVRDDDVRVQLRIAGARRAVAERRGDEPVGRHDARPAAPAPDRGGRALEVAERLADGRSCAARTASPVASSPSPNSTLTLLGAENVRSKAATARRARASAAAAVARVVAREQPPQRVAVDRAVEPELARRAPSHSPRASAASR